ncbi:hypothetical protein BDV19DRAFT_361044 [Aspergillus venezuelensis]
MLGTTVNHLLHDEKLVKGCICRLVMCRLAYVRGKRLLVVFELEVCEEFGVHGKISVPQPISTNAPTDGHQLHFRRASPGNVLPGKFPFARLPQELLDLILIDLDQRERFALLRTSKSLYGLMRKPLYSSVRIRGKKGLAKFARAVKADPQIREDVRSYWLMGDVFCMKPEELELTFDSERLSNLRELHLQPVHQAEDECSFLLPMLQKIVSGRMIQSLKSFYLKLPYDDRKATKDDFVEFMSMIYSIMSTPSLERIGIIHRPPEARRQSYSSFKPGQPPSPPYAAKTKFTNLRTLNFHWHAFPLSWLQACLQLPRSLESLKLSIASRYTHHRVDGHVMALSDLLKPVARSLRTLQVVFEEDGTWSGNVDPHLTGAIMNRLEKLRSLSVPGFPLKTLYSGKQSWVLPLLTTLCLTDAWVEEYTNPSQLNKDNDNDNDNSGSNPDDQSLVSLDTKSYGCILSMINHLPKLEMLMVQGENCGHVKDTLGIRVGLQPGAVVVVGDSLRQLVDRGIRVGIEVAGVVRKVLEVRVMDSLR